MVVFLEIVNSVIENIVNFISPDFYEMIKKIKYLKARAVLIGAVVALIIAILILTPKYQIR